MLPTISSFVFIGESQFHFNYIRSIVFHMTGQKEDFFGNSRRPQTISEILASLHGKVIVNPSV